MSLFRSRGPKPQSFDYKPRFFDPKKEELKKTAKRVQQIQESGLDASKIGLERGFSRRRSNNNRHKNLFRSNMLLFAVIAVLLLISYKFLDVYLPEFVQWLEKN